jgi:hypothetical protein
MPRFLLVLGLATLYAANPHAKAQSDRDLTEKAVAAVRTYPHYTLFDSIEVNVENRMVRLEGHVTTSLKREDIGHRVHNRRRGVGVQRDRRVAPLAG